MGEEPFLGSPASHGAHKPRSAIATTSQSAGTTPRIGWSNSNQCGFQGSLAVAGRTFQATGKAHLR